MTDIEAAKEFWKDHVARLTMGKPLLDPYAAGLSQGRKLLSEDIGTVVYGLERLVRDTTIDGDVQARAHKLLSELRNGSTGP